jgi:hypothetical protein
MSPRTPLAAFLAIVLAGGAVEPAPLEGSDSAASPAIPGLRGVPVGSDRGGTPPTNDVAAATSLAAGAPTPTGAIGTVLLGGYATWYETPGLTAAAGPVLRDVLGDWRGQYVTVEGDGASVTVRLTDFCACRDRHGLPTLLDLSDAAFSELAPLSAGVIRVSIEIDPPEHEADRRMRLEDRELPATDQEDSA